MPTLSIPGNAKAPVIKPIQQTTAPATVDYTKYTTIAQEFTGNQDVTVDTRCNQWTVINRSTLAVRVNGMPLNPPPAVGLSGESFSVGGNAGEIYTGRIQIVFDPAETAPSVVIVQKIYLP